MKSKTIIISSQDDQEKGRGILTLFQEDDLLKCKLRLYNTKSLNRFCKLGVYHQNEVYSANLLEKSGTYTSSLVGDFDIDKDFYTAIIDTSNNNQVLLSGGTYAGYFFNDQSVFENQNIFDRVEKENPNTNLFNYDGIEEKSFDYTQDDNHQTINEDCEKCQNCKYKEYFYSTQHSECEDKENFNSSFDHAQEDMLKTQQDKAFNVEDKTIAQSEKQIDCQEEKTEDKTTILQAIIPQFQYVFENYQADETLNNLIPNSKFVKINENQEQYSIGAIYENEEMKYICYAVLKDYNTPAPQELGEHYQWLPLDKEDPLSEGYYIVFQDASDLKIVEL